MPQGLPADARRPRAAPALKRLLETPADQRVTVGAIRRSSSKKLKIRVT